MGLLKTADENMHLLAQAPSSEAQGVPQSGTCAGCTAPMPAASGPNGSGSNKYNHNERGPARAPSVCSTYLPMCIESKIKKTPLA